MNRAQRRAAGLKGKRYKKAQEERIKQEVVGYLVFSGRAPGRAAAEAIYEQYRKENKR